MKDLSYELVFEWPEIKNKVEILKAILQAIFFVYSVNNSSLDYAVLEIQTVEINND